MTMRLNEQNKVVGAKQVKRALQSSTVQTVYIADDADMKVTGDIIEFCDEKQISVVRVETMKELGSACGIDINAAVAALLK
ncbi:ribosomal L7Ae/L30e/S12e/Gadd45 family protein [Wansuia hejianensis]|uniref:Ribosomal L7Ae/L30e/S12e/Gadd45 family protein n=1 Tax=Wansuia hejianensis TaxID=2763667 RepID=A0A926F051_9FIRM|nr:ribosomal L7Ae/L30e/S12e/Gadd45 family protein [Wansuia hejianensis]MBC8591593.1 ribosomal L7Ae/L30e/S12e/Gadd45 family protein [Wansuia hejianensis]